MVKILISLLVGMAVLTVGNGCTSYAVWKESSLLSIEKEKIKAARADGTPEGFMCTVENTDFDYNYGNNSNPSPHIEIKSVTPGIVDEWSGYLAPGQKIYIRLLGPAIYEAHASICGRELPHGTCKEVYAGHETYDGTQYVTAAFKFRSR